MRTHIEEALRTLGLNIADLNKKSIHQAYLKLALTHCPSKEDPEKIRKEKRITYVPIKEAYELLVKHLSNSQKDTPATKDSDLSSDVTLSQRARGNISRIRYQAAMLALKTESTELIYELADMALSKMGLDRTKDVPFEKEFNPNRCAVFGEKEDELHVDVLGAQEFGEEERKQKYMVMIFCHKEFGAIVAILPVKKVVSKKTFLHTEPNDVVIRRYSLSSLSSIEKGKYSASIPQHEFFWWAMTKPNFEGRDTSSRIATLVDYEYGVNPLAGFNDCNPGLLNIQFSEFSSICLMKVASILGVQDQRAENESMIPFRSTNYSQRLKISPPEYAFTAGYLEGKRDFFGCALYLENGQMMYNVRSDKAFIGNFSALTLGTPQNFGFSPDTVLVRFDGVIDRGPGYPVQCPLPNMRVEDQPYYLPGMQVFKENPREPTIHDQQRAQAAPAVAQHVGQDQQNKYDSDAREKIFKEELFKAGIASLSKEINKFLTVLSTYIESKSPEEIKTRAAKNLRSSLEEMLNGRMQPEEILSWVENRKRELNNQTSCSTLFKATFRSELKSHYAKAIELADKWIKLQGLQPQDSVTPSSSSKGL